MSKSFQIRLSDDDRADLDYLAERCRLDRADVVRLMVRKYAAELREAWADYEREQAAGGLATIGEASCGPPEAVR